MEQKGKSAVKELLENNILSISAYLKLLNGILNSFEARIVGEVSEVKISSVGHVYFSLKDKKDKSVLSCVVWNYDYKLCGVELKEGLEIIAKGIPDVYPPTGRLSFKAKTIQLMGEGELKKEYEKLKKKLEDEGLFDLNKKKEIPSFVKRVGIITSKQGAVISDFLNNLGRFGFQIKFIDSRVEGLEAVRDLLNSVKTMKKQDIDVLVIMRGGGSLESFLAFNNEILIREIASLPFPVIAAIGHDKDVPLLSLVADKMVSTPTAAANLLNQSWQEAELELKAMEREIFNSFSSSLRSLEYKINSLFLKIKDKLEKVISLFKMIEFRIKTVIPKILENEISKMKDKLGNIEKTINQNDPERNLKLGYCIANSKKGVIKNINDVKVEDIIDLKVYNGIINTQVKKTQKNEGKKS
ncbi:MAG TPA: exodeoxyribonuclease VII large subunit [Candidatus Pacearchaeota archaeon]|nr:exodeoxyribonuclease VII large subunit [Candidatus Pacearchaeota archaeon]HPR80200.1 exodeoxyribonuclease VII large subunit [Candidatus Pacearchaeota archaeon]